VLNNLEVLNPAWNGGPNVKKVGTPPK